MSRGARFFLGGIAILLGLLMALIAPDGSARFFFYAFAAFCALIGLVCFTQGRTRQFCGSVIGVCVIGTGIWYLTTQLLAGPVVSGSRAQPSVLNAVLFNVVFGLPSVFYVWRTRFGFARVAP